MACKDSQAPRDTANDDKHAKQYLACLLAGSFMCVNCEWIQAAAASLIAVYHFHYHPLLL